MRRLAPVLLLAACGGHARVVPPPAVDEKTPPTAAEDRRYCAGLGELLLAAELDFDGILGERVARPGLDIQAFVSKIQLPGGDCVVMTWESPSYVRCDMGTGIVLADLQDLYREVGSGVVACTDETWTVEEDTSFISLTGELGITITVATEDDADGSHHIALYVYPPFSRPIDSYGSGETIEVPARSSSPPAITTIPTPPPPPAGVLASRHTAACMRRPVQVGLIPDGLLLGES